MIGKLAYGVQIPWSLSSAKRVKDSLRKAKADIMHVHNVFPLLSPSIYHVAKSAGVSVVQTLHDFRFLCPQAFFFREGRPCEECLAGSLLASVWHGCFGGSKVLTLPVTAMVGLHRMLGTFDKQIDAYICLTPSQRSIFLKAGFEKAKLHVKPNYIEDIQSRPRVDDGKFVLFLGRLSEEKGLACLIRAWKELNGIPLKIVGSGPGEAYFKAMADRLETRDIEFLGYMPHSECMNLLDEARFLIVPSIWYETFGLTIVEAFSRAKPVIASDLGAMADLVSNGDTGLLFEANNSMALAERVRFLWTDVPTSRQMGKKARQDYEEKFQEEKNYQELLAIYQKATEK